MHIVDRIGYADPNPGTVCRRRWAKSVCRPGTGTLPRVELRSARPAGELRSTRLPALLLLRLDFPGNRAIREPTLYRPSPLSASRRGRFGRSEVARAMLLPGTRLARIRRHGAGPRMRPTQVPSKQRPGGHVLTVRMDEMPSHVMAWIKVGQTSPSVSRSIG